MRISTSDGYYHGFQCDIGDCERRYCNEHRLLWRDCDTAKTATEGDFDVIGGTREVYEMGECPECEVATRRREIERRIAA